MLYEYHMLKTFNDQSREKVYEYISSTRKNRLYNIADMYATIVMKLKGTFSKKEANKLISKCNDQMVRQELSLYCGKISKSTIKVGSEYERYCSYMFVKKHNQDLFKDARWMVNKFGMARNEALAITYFNDTNSGIKEVIEEAIKDEEGNCDYFVCAIDRLMPNKPANAANILDRWRKHAIKNNTSIAYIYGNEEEKYKYAEDVDPQYLRLYHSKDFMKVFEDELKDLGRDYGGTEKFNLRLPGKLSMEN